MVCRTAMEVRIITMHQGAILIHIIRMGLTNKESTLDQRM